MNGAFERVNVSGSELSLSRIGFGCARLFSGSEMRASERLIEAALSVGIRHFDTAPSYGAGQSEEVLGAVLAGVPDVTITTKVGLVTHFSTPNRLGPLYRKWVRPVLGRIPRLKRALLAIAAARREYASVPAMPAPLISLPYDEVRRSLEGSLRRLRRDSVDILLLHEPDRFLLDDSLLRIFSELQREGMIRAYGLGWDRAVSAPPAFGQIIQSRYPSPDALEGGPTHIFHGVLRHARNTSSAEAQIPAPARIWRVLDAFPKSAVIFSASSRMQILQMSQPWRE